MTFSRGDCSLLKVTQKCSQLLEIAALQGYKIGRYLFFFNILYCQVETDWDGLLSLIYIKYATDPHIMTSFEAAYGSQHSLPIGLNNQL